MASDVFDKSCGRLSMLTQMSRLQAVRVDGRDDLAEQRTKASRNLLQFVVEGVLVQVLIDVAHQMDQAFLLRARNQIIRGIEIRDEHAVKPMQQIFEDRASRNSE